ncbi:retinitis pigmentosa 1-like 1 protein isoform X2 [Sander lucioperca]|uniref:retinitis pigmentosa 1-like 1 protein isoform X2 n=1 Tax=Sander lucioperca TaxID=283035 RepID=UPI001653C620|nr:retinitis pigmentosa 1-like 1 protein isoform X2 [Sander lucioperca]
MYSVEAGMWDPQPPSKHASSISPRPPSNLRPAHVIAAPPAKRITFYKSGDRQFGGVKMAIQKRSFKCFDALLDDLSQKVPLPFGVRTVTTPRGIHAIKHLEQLQDGGCYLCSDRRQAKPVNMELAGKRPTIWYHHSRRPQQPESSSTTPPGHQSNRQRRILLVKNSEPGMRRSVVLSRRSTRSLKSFLDEVSEVMQFHVRKLYTAEGRRIDSVQNLMTCPGTLVCVGREAFSPLLVNFIRKSSEEKLPGLGSRGPALGPRTPGNGARSPATQGARSPPRGAQSRASEYSEGHESRKNVNFGLETKKSIIHPRSDSSNRSTRFSLSSEKSFSNGVSAYSQARPAIMNDDIEKRVLVNKDGSLSVEMRVRFRLHNDETLQWSTQVKKSPSLTNECCPLSQAQPHYLQQGQSESCSDSTSFDPEGVDYSNQPVQHVLEGNQCPCCYQRQEQQYDLWENPAHSQKQHPVPPPHPPSHAHTLLRHTHSSSSSSSCNSRRVVRCRARVTNCGAGSKQSQLVQEEMFMTEQVERRVELEQDGDTQVEVCRMSQCCSRSEVVAIDSNLRPLSRKSAEDELMMEEEGERPLSAISSSSHILQSLQEDQDDDLPPSASQCCHSNEPSPSPTSQTHLSDKPTSSVAAVYVHSTEHETQEEDRGSRAVSVASSCHCGAATPHSTAEAEEMDRAPSSKSKPSRASSRSSKVRIPNSEEEGAADDEDEDVKRVVSGLSGHTGCSLQSRGSSVCPNCGGCKRGVNSESNSRASQRSQHSHRASPKQASPLSSQENANNGSDDDDGSEGSDGSTKSNKTNLTNNGRCSAISNILEDRASSAMSNPDEAGKEEERALSATSATSHRSNRSHKSGYNGSPCGIAQKEEERSPSAMSAQSNMSAKSSKSHKSNCSCTADAPDIKTTEDAEEENNEERALSSLSAKSGASAETSASVKKGTKVASPTDNTAVEENDTNKRTPSALSDKPGEAERPDSVMSAKSAKSNVSAKSGTSHRSTCSHYASRADGPVIKAIEQEEEMESEERAASAMSDKSNLSAKSNKSHKSIKDGEDGEERAASQVSGRLVKSNTSNSNDNETAASPSSKEKENELGEDEQQRPESVISAKSASSAKSHRTNCDTSSRVASPAKDTAKTEVDGMEDRTPSAMSSKSHTSAKSSKSQKSNQTTASPNPNEDAMPSIEINGKEEHNENRERVASAMSVKSKSSMRSRTSHKSSKNLKLVSPSPNVVTFQTPEGVDEDGNETTERAQSAASAKSGKSNVSTLSRKSHHKRTADVAVIETADADENVEDNSTKSKSHGQTLSPRRSCSPLTHSPKAASPSRSGKSKCGCGAASALEKSKEEKEGEKKENPEELKNEEASERAASILSSSSRRQRRESGGTEQPLSRNSSGSVSLGLPEDQEIADSDSGKSCVSFHTNTGEKDRVKTVTPHAPKSSEQSALKEERGGTGSIMSQMSNSKSTHNHPAVDIPTIKTTGGSRDKGEEGGEQTTERGASALSAKSSRSHKSSCSCGVKAPRMLDSKPKQHTSASPTKAGNDLETASLKSASTTKASKMDANDNRTSSAMSAASAKARSKSPANASAENANVAGDSGDNHTATQAISRPASKAEGEEDIADNKAASVQSKSPHSLRPDSAASAHSGSKMKASKEIKSNSRPSSKVETSSGSTLHHSMSAADMLKKTMAAAAAVRPNSQQSKASKTSDKSRSKKSQRSRNQTDHEELELSPACLPNASPNEVVSDWLRNIPANSCMLALGDGLNEEEQEKVEEEKPGEEEAKEEGSPEVGKVEDKEEDVEADEEEQKEEEAECDAAEEEKSSDPAPVGGDAVGTRPKTLLSSSDALPKSWHSSVAVMKVLLSSSPGRCQSMPEVSPVYGRRLSTSARGFLDCLAQLQLIEPKVTPGFDQQKDHNQQYEDIMAILQSLWLTSPRDIETKEGKDVGTEQVTPPRSSSGVGMSSGSGGSGKENGTQGGDETNQNKTKESSLHEEEEGGAEKVGEEEEEGNAEAELKETEAEPEETDVAEEEVQSEEQSPSLDSPKATENPSSSDKSSANDSSKSPTDNEHETAEDSGSSGTPPTVLRAPLSKRLSQDPDPVWVLHLLKKLEKQFMDHYIDAMAEFKVRWDLDDSLMLDTMIGELREEVSRRIQSSIQREVRKIQSRAGRGGKLPRPPQSANLSRESTVTEKRRQILKVMKNQSVKTADCLSDGEMTAEFSDQRSDDEFCPCDACVRKKMAARPLKANPLAAEAPVMMEFDLLKILQLKKTPSPVPAVVSQSAEVEGDSEVADEEGRNLEVVQEEEEEEETKEDIKADVVLEETIPEEDEEIGKEEEDGGEAGDDEEEEAEKEESIAGVEDQEEKETGGEETGEEETSGNGVEEEEAECQCQCARNEEESDKAEEGEEETAGEAAEETSDNAAEDETGDDEERAGEEEGENAEDEEEPGGNDGETATEKEEEESDKETVKEATAGEGETTENVEGEEEEAEVEECEVSEFKEEDEEKEGEEEGKEGEEEEEVKEEVTGKESGEDEDSGETEDDSAAKNEESTPLEEFVEGNVSASAEGDDAAGEGESHEDEKEGESEEPADEASEEERTSSKGQGVTVTEGEEADAEESDTDSKRPSNTSVAESGREGAGATEDEEGREGGEDGDEADDAVEEFKPEEEEEEDGEVDKRENGALFHQFTRTSVESQPGSLEDIGTESPHNLVSSIEVPKRAACVCGQRRSRSPGRVKRSKPKECDVELN